MSRIRALLIAAAWCGSMLAQAADPAPATVAPPPAYGPAIALAEARTCVAAAQAEAARNQWFMVVTVVDAGGHEVLTERMDNTQFGSLLPAAQKARTAVSFRRPTKVFEDMVAQGGAAMRILRLDELIPIDGGLPLLRGGAIIGGVGVSGGTAQQDGVVAAACVAALD